MRNMTFFFLLAFLLMFTSAFAAQVNYGFLDSQNDTLSGTTSYLPSSAGQAMYYDAFAYPVAVFSIFADSLASNITVKIQVKSAASSNWNYSYFEVMDPTEAAGPQLSTEYAIAAESDPTVIMVREHYNNVRIELTHTAGDVIDSYGALIKENGIGR